MARFPSKYIDDWTDAEDEDPLGAYEDPDVPLTVDWIEGAEWEKEERQWKYRVKWTGWKRNANTSEPFRHFDDDEMPNDFWKHLGLHFEPQPAPNKAKSFSTDNKLMEKWVGAARRARDKRTGKQRKPAPTKPIAEEDDSGEDPLPPVDKGKKRATIPEASSSKPKPKIPAKETKPSAKDVRKANREQEKKDKFNEARRVRRAKEREEKQAAVEKAKAAASTPKKPRQTSNSFLAAATISPPTSGSKAKTKPTPSRPRAQSKPSQPSQPIKKPFKFTAANFSSDEDELLLSRNGKSEKKRAVMEDEEDDDDKPLVKKPKPAASETSAPMPLSSQRVDPPLPSIPRKSSGSTLKPKLETPKEVKPHDWTIPGTEKLPSLFDKPAKEDHPASAPPSKQSSTAPTSHNRTISQPKKDRLTVSLLLGPKPSSSHPRPQQTVGLVDLTDISPFHSPDPRYLPPGTFPKEISKLIGPGGGGRASEIAFEQMFSLYRVAGICKTAGSILQYARLEASVGAAGEGADGPENGDSDDVVMVKLEKDKEEKARSEERFRKMAIYLEHSLEGGSVSIAYLPSNHALLLLPRSSPLCIELKVPEQLRDPCHPFKETLTLVLVNLARPVLPLPNPSRPLVLSSDAYLDSWGFTFDFINSLRTASPPPKVFIFSPFSLPSFSTSLHSPASTNAQPTPHPAIVKLGEYLTDRPHKALEGPGVASILSPAEAGEADLVLVHNSMRLWKLPGLVQLRRREDVKFWAFGEAKQSLVREDMFLLHPFGLDTRTKVTFTPTVFLEDATLLRKDLIPILKDEGKYDYEINLHPSTILHAEAEANADRAANKNATLSVLLNSTRFGSSSDLSSSFPLVIGVSEPPNPSLAPALIEHNLDLESAIEGASAFPQVLDGLKAYCGGEALLGLERCEKEVGEMMRGFSTNPSAIQKYRRFLVVGPTLSTSADIQDLKTGVEHISTEDFLAELKSRYASS